MKTLAILSSLVILCACTKDTTTKTDIKTTESAKTVTPTPVTAKQNATDLVTILDSQTDEAKARFIYRHPKETLEFFGIKKGMTVAEALPGGGWYSKILIPFLGEEGKLIGVDYPIELWSNFGFVDDAFIERRKEWESTWVADAQGWQSGGATIDATTFGNISEQSKGSVDLVLFIRALHNMHRFKEKGDFLKQALADTHMMLKPGGMVGVVQHSAAEDKTDEWADGSKGYLKKSTVIAAFEKSGFRFVKSSPVNENALDRPEEEDIVWRLPPNLSTSSDNKALKASYINIGESNRMTLLFQKVE